MVRVDRFSSRDTEIDGYFSMIRFGILCLMLAGLCVIGVIGLSN